MTKRKNKILSIIGTRPEAIKMAPVIKEIAKRKSLESVVCVTGQHRHMLDQVMEIFDLHADFDLNLMRRNQTLSSLTSRCVDRLEKVITECKPECVLVQGDTTTAFIGALSAFYQRVRVGHVEGGLRTSDKYSPFPEEINRRLVSCIADFHFAPTIGAQKNLIDENIPARKIWITGNTVIDALLFARKTAETLDFSQSQDLKPLAGVLNGAERIILVTGHRRESFGKGFEEICKGIASIALQEPEVHLIYPVHLNPQVKGPVFKRLGNFRNIHLIPPIDYLSMVKLLDRSYLILTDSGGIQEEAPTFGKPVLVMREVTERPEGVAAGVSRLVGPHSGKIAKAALALLRNRKEYLKMSRRENPYGKGTAAKTIADILEKEL
jgi:UDP-N-acetylglucosamine 2-epimerase (non-hydrolysing)